MYKVKNQPAINQRIKPTKTFVGVKLKTSRKQLQDNELRKRKRRERSKEKRERKKATIRPKAVLPV